MKTLAVVILDKFADWEPALLTAGLQSIIGGYPAYRRAAEHHRRVHSAVGVRRSRSENLYGRAACGTRYDDR